MKKVRTPAVAGQFYPEDPSALTEAVRDCMSSAGHIVGKAPSGVTGCIVPHAGYMYSGSTAACTYTALIPRAPGVVVLIGPSHRDYFTYVSVYDGDAYATPLGDVSVDTDLAAAIAADGGEVRLGDVGHRGEHALEVQVPFLQTIFPGVPIVPITMGTQDRAACEHLAVRLTQALKGADAVLIASSDLSHFHPYDEARRMDGESERMIASFDADAFAGAIESGRVEACGGGPVVSVMMASKELGATDSHVLFSCNSGDVSGDRSGVVGYISAVFGRSAA